VGTALYLVCKDVIMNAEPCYTAGSRGGRLPYGNPNNKRRGVELAASIHSLTLRLSSVNGQIGCSGCGDQAAVPARESFMQRKATQTLGACN
jgi:hypothetical protein